MPIANTLSETIGNTPLLRLTRIMQGIEPLIAAKCEFFSPSGSLKDRILHHMVESAKREGGLRPGMTIIEGSTGNTGIATAMVAAATKAARKYPKTKLIATILPDHEFRYFSSELCGVEPSVEVPERDHPLDDHTLEMLDRYQGKWKVIR